MPYYSANQPQKARPFAQQDEASDDANVIQILTDDRRLHLYGEGRISIRKPRLDRVLAAASGKGLTVLSLWMGGNLVLIGLHPFGSGNAVSNTISASMISLAAINLWWLAGPDDLDFDLRQRTYQYRRGFLYFAPTVQGTFCDLLTIRVQSYSSSRRKAQYCLLLIWNVPRRRATNLGQFETLEQANAQRARLLDAFEL